MTSETREREFDKRVRHLCAQVVLARGPEFEVALLELANAIALWKDVSEGDDGEKAAKAG